MNLPSLFRTARCALPYLLVPSLCAALPPRGFPGDLWADIILGQTDDGIPNSAFGSMTSNQASDRILNRGGTMAIDRTHNRLYIWDGGNNRIVGYSDLSVLSPNYAANQAGIPFDIVIGQPDFSHTSCNGDSNYQTYPGIEPNKTIPPPNQYQVCGQPPWNFSPWEGAFYGRMAVDGQGNLYVPDSGNNRVLRYNFADLHPYVPGQAPVSASYVWGQPDFTSNLPNHGNPGPVNNGFNFTMDANGVGACAVDPQGNLWVADSWNHRVLRFPNPSGTCCAPPQATADLVIGQTNFANNAPDTTLSTLTDPSNVKVDASGNVFVVDHSAPWGRLLIFRPVTINGQSAVTTVENGLDTSYGFDLEPSGDVWIAYSDPYSVGNDQIVDFKVNIPPAGPVTITPYRVLMQDHFLDTGQPPQNPSTGSHYFNYNYPPGISLPAWFQTSPVGVVVDADGNVYSLALTSGTQSVWRFPGPIPTPQAGRVYDADVDLLKGYEPNRFPNLIGPANLAEGQGVAIAEDGPQAQLIVADNRRLMYWDIPSSGPQGALSNGQVPNGYAGVDTITVNAQGPTLFGRVHVDHGSPAQHLWAVATNNNNGYLQRYDLPLSNYASPVSQLGSPLPLLGMAGVSVSWNNGLDGGCGLTDMLLPDDPSVPWVWVTDASHFRVLRVRDPLTHPQVDIVLGQSSPTGSGCNNGGNYTYAPPTGCDKAIGSDGLNFPGSLAMDHQGNLYISDFWLESEGNFRLLEFNASIVAAAVSVANATGKVSCGWSASHVYENNGDMTAFGANGPPGSPSISGPYGVAFTSDDRYMVLGNRASGSFPIVVPDPLTQFDPTPSNPWTYLNDYGSVSVISFAFDKHDNLYTTNLNRANVLIYLNPFSIVQGSPSPTASATATPTMTPTGSFSPTPTRSPTPTSTSTPTWSPTATPSPTITLTPTVTSTPTESCREAVCYPNPLRFGDSIQWHLSPCDRSRGIRIRVFTTTYRKVLDRSFSEVPTTTDPSMELTDQYGKSLANGVYYLVLDSAQGRTIRKLIVLR